MPGPDIFLSYSREDRHIARRFADALEVAGFSVWWDNILHPGETFDEVIEHNLRSSTAVVVLWTPRSVNSRWVRAEATLGDKTGKLVPVVVEPCDRPLIFELTHSIDLSQWDGALDDERWQGFLTDLRRLASRQVEMERRQGAAALLERVWSVPTDGQFGSTLPADPGDGATQFATRSAAFCETARELHVLTVATGPAMGSHVVGPLGLHIGRTPPADLVIVDPRVSRSHCLVEWRDGELRVSDLQSTNGTFIDGERIERDAPFPLGAELRVGSAVLVHECVGGAQPVA